MKRFSIKRMYIENFKGIKKMSIDFSEITRISGANATCKTSVLDAYMWCLLDVDSFGKSNFKVQPLDEKGNVIDNLITFVEVQTFVDNQQYNFKRKYYQNWIKPRGKTEPINTGNLSEYYYNDVPCMQTEFQAKLNSIVSLSDFKLVSSVTAFNKLNTEQKRAVLIDISGIKDIDKEVATEFPLLRVQLEEYNKSVKEYSAEVRMKISKLKDDLKSIPIRIDELEKQRPEKLDFEALKIKESRLKKEIEEITTSQQSSSGNDLFLDNKKTDLKKKMNELQGQMNDIELSLNKQSNSLSLELSKELSGVTNDKNISKEKIDSLVKQIEELYSKQEKLNKEFNVVKEEWKTINNLEFSVELEPVCSQCNRPFSNEDLQNQKHSAVELFNKNKLDKLSKIDEKGDELSKEIKEIISKIDNKNEERRLETERFNSSCEKVKDVESRQNNLPTLAALQEANKEYQKLKLEYDQTKAQLTSLDAPIEENKDTQDALKQEKELSLKEIRTSLAKEQQIINIDLRKEELREQEINISQLIAELEEAGNQIMLFNKKKIDLIESRISGMFSIVKFKMFEKNITNDGEKEICDCMVDGVPYENLNTAMKINAGLDICNTLSRSLGIIAPIWIDNKESVTDLIQSDSQLITLQVVEGLSLTIN
ncbi:MAG: hypothetical protein A2X18_07490 [Bacteroidetes bacterium GWF2_40_14]|nr:MAG: hypothetical protein A2X18_07490 [Bacteroidetes bacterium GWF2_40_14]